VTKTITVITTSDLQVFTVTARLESDKYCSRLNYYFPDRRAYLQYPSVRSCRYLIPVFVPLLEFEFTEQVIVNVFSGVVFEKCFNFFIFVHNIVD
jgi:hypothetical protein